MPDVTVATASMFAGVLCAVAVLIAGGGRRARSGPLRAPRMSATRIREAVRIDRMRSWLQSELDRAGWDESPERVGAFAIALSACLATLAASSASTMPAGAAGFMCLLGMLAGLGLPLLAPRSAGAQRRRRLEAPRVPPLQRVTPE